MGMLIHHTWQAQQAMQNEPEVTEEIPFTEPEEDSDTLVEEPEKKTVRKAATTTTRRRKSAK